MDSLPDALDVPDNWRDFPGNAKQNWLESNTTCDDIRTALVTAYSLPENGSEQVLTKEQLVALALQLEGGNE